MPDGALTSFTVCETYRYLADQASQNRSRM